jgi:RNA polymerase sigma-70 factor (ECF subfamily)
MLRFVEQMSYEAIAGVVGCNVGTVRSRIHYAKRALREIIERKQSS